MAKSKPSATSPPEIVSLIAILEQRFHANINRHPDLEWESVKAKLLRFPDKLKALLHMEESGGEPDVIAPAGRTSAIVFMDCSPESPSGRRSCCYDKAGLESRKEHLPANNAIDLAAKMGIELLDEAGYRLLQQFGPFDRKTSSWILTPPDIRKLGGALFGDYRYGKVFVYHNGAQSYYAARGFRGSLLLK